MADFQITVGFDHSKPAGIMALHTDIAGLLPPDLYNYVLTPAYAKRADGQLHVLEYALVHHSQLPPPDVWAERNKQALDGPAMENL